MRRQRRPALTKMELPVSADCGPSSPALSQGSEPARPPRGALGPGIAERAAGTGDGADWIQSCHSCRDLFGTAEALMAGVPPALGGGGAVLSRAAASPGSPTTTLNC